MKDANKSIQSLKPVVSKRTLMLIAGFVWSIPSTILLSKGIQWLSDTPYSFLLGMIISIVLGILFYHFLFNKISAKYINRIKDLENERPFILSFFNKKGYIMMGGMILLGVVLRTTGIIPVLYLSILYITMGIPLTISTFRFFCNWFKF